MGGWSKQGCIKSAQEYDDLKAWIRGRKTAYLAARNNSWLDECCAHMFKQYRDKVTKPVEKCCSHRKGEQLLIRNELCLGLAISFDSINKFKSSEPTIYNMAKERGLLPKIKDIIDARNAKAWIDKNIGER